jgi:hypothetical protein
LFIKLSYSNNQNLTGACIMFIKSFCVSTFGLLCDGRVLMSWFVVICFASIILPCTLLAESYKLSLEERKAIENRKSITRYNLEIKINQSDVPDLVGLNFCVDGDNLRHERVYSRVVRSKDFKDLYSIVYVYQKDKVTTFMNEFGEGDPATSVTIVPRDTDELILPPDIRMIGMNPICYAYHEIETVLGRADREDSTVTDEILNGIACKKFTYIHPEFGVKYTYWIAPKFGYSVIRMHSYYDGKPRSPTQEPTAITSYTDSIVSEYKNTGIWFPTELHHVFTVGGKLERTQDMFVKIISLNEPIDPELFTLKGLNVPAGTAVILLPESEYDNFFWDGHEIKSERGYNLSTPQNTDRLAIVRLVLIVIGLGLIAAACLVRYFKMIAKKNK